MRVARYEYTKSKIADAGCEYTGYEKLKSSKAAFHNSHLNHVVIPELRNEMSGISCHVDVSYSIP